MGTFSGVTSAGIVISSARGGTCKGPARSPGTPGWARSHPHGGRAPHLLGELLAHQGQDQRRLPHLGCAGQGGQRGDQGQGAPRPPRPSPRAPAAAAPRPPARRLPSPSNRMRTSRLMAAAPGPGTRPRPGPQAFALPPCPPRTSGIRPRAGPILPAPPAQPHKRVGRARTARCVAAPLRGRAGHCRQRRLPAPGRPVIASEHYRSLDKQPIKGRAEAELRPGVTRDSRCNNAAIMQ